MMNKKASKWYYFFKAMNKFTHVSSICIRKRHDKSDITLRQTWLKCDMTEKKYKIQQDTKVLHIGYMLTV
jgi:hypothetical protein